MKSYDLDVLAPESIKIKVKIHDKEYCASPVFTTMDRIRFNLLMKQAQSGEIEDKEFAEKISEFFVILFKPSHPKITAEFFINLPEVKMEALTVIILRDVIYRLEDSTPAETGEGTEDFPQIPREEVVEEVQA